MEQQKPGRKECDYYELLQRLDRANESLAFFKNNKEICLKDLSRLELENSALAEENDYLKKRIRNAEKNASLLQSKSMSKLDISQDPYQISGSFISKRIPSLDMSLQQHGKDLDTAETMPSHRKYLSNPVKISNPAGINRSVSSKNFKVGDFAMLRSAFLFHL